MRLWWILALTFLLIAPSAFPQASAINGQIEGTVTDPTGAVVPNAKVDIKNENTGYTRSGDTDANGFYRFTTLPLGRYTVTVDVSGFQKFTATGVDLTAGAIATVNAA